MTRFPNRIRRRVSSASSFGLSSGRTTEEIGSPSRPAASAPTSQLPKCAERRITPRPRALAVLDPFVRESRPDVLFGPAGDLQELEKGGAEVLDRCPSDASDRVPIRVGEGAGQVLEEQSPPPARKTQEEWGGAAADSRSGPFRENPQHSRDEEKDAVLQLVSEVRVPGSDAACQANGAVVENRGG